MRVPGYIRYMDDFCLFAPDKGRLKALRKPIKVFLAERLALTLKPSGTFLNSARHGLPYPGTTARTTFKWAT